MSPLPTVVVHARGVARLRAGHPWVYRSDIAAVDGVPAGALVRVADERGKPLGSAFYSTASQIAVRLLSRQVLADEAAARPLLRERILAAADYRERVVRESDACRLVFSEADQLPGLIVDRYNDVLAVQPLTQAMDREERVAAVVETLAERFHPAGVVVRADPRIRQLEQLPARESKAVVGDKTRTAITMNGVRFHHDALAGQKTGAFLDQRENYAAAASLARGEALDVFCYQGGFALHLARVCSRVTGVDSSRPALEAAEENAALNPGAPEIEWMEANAFDLMKDYAAAGREYDTIVLDPPAFAKTRSALETALRGYKELNLRALKMLRPGGLLVTCSCSYHVSTAEFLAMLGSASQDAHRLLRIVETRGAAKDHPAVPTIPETSYLKCVLAVA